MKRLNWCLALLTTASLCGCLQVKDELTIQADGSGTVRLEVQAAVADTMMEGMSSAFGNGATYPPTSESQARQMFPAKTFALKADETQDGDQKKLMVEASFKAINDLLASPYARHHQLTLKLEDGTLKLKSLGGGQVVARAIGAKLGGEMAQFAPSGIEDLQKRKDQLRFEFRVTMPAAITQANGTKEGKTVAWVIERGKCKDDDEFAKQSAVLLEAQCSAGSWTTPPVTPPRLALGTFNELRAESVASSTPPPDTNRIASAARFVPLSLRVTRSMDLSGEGNSQGSQAELSGVVVLPNELAPSQWGSIKLEEAVDAKGKSLVPKEDSPSAMSMRFGATSFDATDQEENEDSAKAPTELQRMFKLMFNAPEWKVKRIARIRASIPLQYLGGSEVVKLTNAVPANRLMDMSNPAAIAGFGRETGQLSDPRLTALGMSVGIQMAMVQSGMVMLSLETTGAKATLIDAQVFDAQGEPWPTTLMRSDLMGNEEHSSQVMVAGQPKPPLSLALVVSGVGATVNLPVLMEQVPLGGN